MRRFEGGNYGTRRGLQYLAAQRHREVQEMMDQIQNREEYLNLLNDRPTWEIWVKHLQDQPELWDSNVHGDFPKNGLMLFYATLPSANRSHKNPSYDKVR